MTGADTAFLIFAIAAFAVFAAVLAWANRQAP